MNVALLIMDVAGLIVCGGFALAACYVGGKADEELEKFIREMKEKEHSMSAKNTIYTRDEAARIVELFEEVLARYDIVVPSPEDDEREEDNAATLYGSVYYDLLDDVEGILIDNLKRASESNVECYRFSGNV